MSIIEKALNKRNENQHNINNNEVSAATKSESTVERAIELSEARSMQQERNEVHLEKRADASPSTSHDIDTACSLYTEIDLRRLRDAGMISPHTAPAQIDEEFRLIKRPLLANAFNQNPPVKNGNLIMVTSCLPNEGKSFCSVNLAMSIAMELDHTVLLVDADVAKPSIPGALGIKADRGLMDILLDDKLEFADVLIKTNIEKFSILPAGRGHRYATELLASDAMDALLQEMATRYHDRVIIFDSPPLLSTTEARVLASHMGQIVMVVEAEKTTQEALKEALSQIETCEIVGLLLNKGKSNTSADYGYGYFGNYGK